MSTPYHPQENGQVEATNKVLENILTIIVHQHQKDWVEKLPEALWAYRITWRNSTSFTPYELVYGKQVFLRIEFEIKTLRTTLRVGMELSEAQQHQLNQLHELNEI